MRISGLATGMDTESIVSQLMQAERLPMNKMEQEKTTLEWQRDKFREIYTLTDSLYDKAFDIQLQKNFHAKSVHSTMENAVTATAGANAPEGTYKIEVEQLATSAINVSEVEMGIDPNKKLGEIEGIELGRFYFATYNDEGKQVQSIDVNAEDTLKDVIQRINNDDNGIRMFYDETSDKVVMETTKTGDYHTGKEITFNSNNTFFQDVLKLDVTNEQGGANAKFTYNDAYTVESTENNYTLNGITFQLNNVTGEDQNAVVTVNNDIDATVDTIKEFVEKYNELIDLMNKTQREEKYRDFPPLTKEQKDAMEEREIELWEEKARSGILRRDSIITSALSNLRQTWYSSIDGDGDYNVMPQIGLTTTRDYLDGGKIEIDEDTLRDALRENPDSVYKLFAGDGDEGKGVLDHVRDNLGVLEKQIEERAGRSSDTLANYTLGRKIKDIDNRMDSFEDRLKQIESRYWRQFTAMEKAIAQMNSQSAMLMNNFFQ